MDSLRVKAFASVQECILLLKSVHNKLVSTEVMKLAGLVVFLVKINLDYNVKLEHEMITLEIGQTDGTIVLAKLILHEVNYHRTLSGV